MFWFHLLELEFLYQFLQTPPIHSAVSQMSLLKCISLFADSLRSSYESQKHLAEYLIFHPAPDPSQYILMNSQAITIKCSQKLQMFDSFQNVYYLESVQSAFLCPNSFCYKSSIGVFVVDVVIPQKNVIVLPSHLHLGRDFFCKRPGRLFHSNLSESRRQVKSLDQLAVSVGL